MESLSILYLFLLNIGLKKSLIYLPNIKFVFRYSRELSLNADGTINMETKTVPHIIVEDPTYHEDFTD